MRAHPFSFINSFRRIAAVVIAVFLCGFAGFRGFTSQSAQAGQPASLTQILPGSSDLDDAKLHGHTIHFAIFDRGARDSIERKVGTWTVDWRFERNRGRAAIRQANTTQFENGDWQLDTLVSLRPGLEPVSVVSRRPNETIEFRFRGARVTGEAAARDSAPRLSETLLPQPVFSSADLLLLLAEVPLHEGDAATVRTFACPSGRSHLDTLRVVTRTPIQTASGSRSAWLVTYSDEQSTSRVWLEEEHRDVLRYEITYRRGGSRRLVPLDHVTSP